MDVSTIAGPAAFAALGVAAMADLLGMLRRRRWEVGAGRALALADAAQEALLVMQNGTVRAANGTMCRLLRRDRVALLGVQAQQVIAGQELGRFMNVDVVPGNFVVLRRLRMTGCGRELVVDATCRAARWRGRPAWFIGMRAPGNAGMERQPN